MATIITYNGTIYPCTYEIDCPGPSVCYYFDKSNPTQGYCSCNVEQGTKGLLCDQTSSAGYARIVTLSLDLAFASVVVLIIFYRLFEMIRMKKMKIFDVRITSLLMGSISLIFFCCYTAVLLYWKLFPNLPLENDKTTGKKRRPYNEFISVSLSISLFFYVTASLNVSIFWLEVAIASKRFKKIDRPQLSRYYRNIVVIFDIVLAIIFGLTSWFALPYISIACIAIYMIIMGLYIYSAYEITKVMKETFQGPQISSPNLNTKKENINQSLLMIKTFALRFLALILMWIVFLVIGASQHLTMYKRAWKDGDGPYFMLLFDIAFLFAIAAVLALVKYVRDASNKTISSKSKTPANEDNDNNKHSATGPSGGVIVPALSSE